MGTLVESRGNHSSRRPDWEPIATNSLTESSVVASALHEMLRSCPPDEIVARLLDAFSSRQTSDNAPTLADWKVATAFSSTGPSIGMHERLMEIPACENSNDADFPFANSTSRHDVDVATTEMPRQMSVAYKHVLDWRVRVARSKEYKIP